MGTDIAKIISNINLFYDFSNKEILHIGAGGGQFLEYARHAKKVIAVDNDPEAVVILKEAIITKGLEQIFTVKRADFYSINLKGDVVFFEFCFHELLDSAAALERARKMAPDVVIIDHAIGSEWAHYADETEKVAKSWHAVEAAGYKNKIVHYMVHYFNTYDELFNKVKCQGERSIERIAKYKGRASIKIPMSYVIVLC